MAAKASRLYSSAGIGGTMSKRSEKEKLLLRLQEVIEELSELESEARQLAAFAHRFWEWRQNWGQSEMISS